MTTLFISHSSKDKQWAEEVREALHGQGYQSLFLDSHPDDGIPAGAKWEQTLWQRLRQSRGVVALCSTYWLASPWCVAEAMMARERGKPVFLLATPDLVHNRQVRDLQDEGAAPKIPDFLKDTQFISLAGLTADEAYQRLWHGLEDEGLRDDFPLPERPYPGLEPFQETDAAVYFGRDDEIALIMDVLNRRRRNNAKGSLLVLGASGCGKSSLVRAGVLPRLRLASVKESSSGPWLILQPVTISRGVEGLAASLADAFKRAGQPLELASLHKRLEVSKEENGGAEHAVQELRELASELLVAGGVPEGFVLLILDQLEEVFGTEEGSTARIMLRLLLEASADVASPVVLLGTMRSDFLNDFQLFPGAAERYEEITLDPMPRSRFSELIEGPADRFGLSVGAGLSARLVEDTRFDDALPLLAFTLEKLYARRRADGALTLQDYQELFPAVPVRAEDGTTTEHYGVSAAIKHRADKILADAGYAGLPIDNPRMLDLRHAFLSLVRLGQGGQFTGRPARKSVMPASCAVVLERFVSERMLVSGIENGEPTLSVSHEALFRVWDTLRDWLREARKALVLRDQIKADTQNWLTNDKRPGYLWSHERVREAVSTLNQLGPEAGLSDEEREFLDPIDAAAMLAELECSETTHRRRALIGERLDTLGDPRSGVGVDPAGVPSIDWCAVPGGEVALQGIGRQKRLDGFHISRYPITVAQYRGFMEAKDGWCLQGWWADHHFRDREGDTYPFGHFGNHPAVYVSWFDAHAFCRWLSRRLDFGVRLPDEWEWKQAATGGDAGKMFPWGKWNPKREPYRAITSESMLGGTTAVGMYPAGASSVGAHDMAGTVWEWCLNNFEDTDATETRSNDKNSRVVLGGSWYSPRKTARCGNRNKLSPIKRGNNIGFRVMCSSPNSGH